MPEVVILEPDIHCDERGFFFESYNEKVFYDAIQRKVKFVQDNHSKSIQGVLRGLHLQSSPYEQAKLVRVIHGEIWDVAVDVRKDSKTYGKWVAETLTSENKKQIWIPEGFAHGFYVLSDVAEIIYKTNNFYSKKHEKTIHWKNNPFNINWPIIKNKIYLSEKDNLLKNNGN